MLSEPTLPFDAETSPDFDGAVYEPARDRVRLAGQVLRIFRLMCDGRWRTVPEVSAATGDPETSVSAQLRHLRKRRFGAHDVDRRRRGGESSSLWEYRVRPNRQIRIDEVES